MLTHSLLLFTLPPCPPRAVLLPYTTLFRSGASGRRPALPSGGSMARGLEARREARPVFQRRPAPHARGVQAVFGIQGELRVRSEEHTSELQSLRHLV